MSDTPSDTDGAARPPFVGETFTEDVKIYVTRKESDTPKVVAAEIARLGSDMTADQIVALNDSRMLFKPKLTTNARLRKATFLLVRGLGEQQSKVTEVEYTHRGACFTVVHQLEHDGSTMDITQTIDERTLLRGLGVSFNHEHVGKKLLHADHGGNHGAVPATVVGYDASTPETWLIRHDDDQLYYKDVDLDELMQSMLAAEQQQPTGRAQGL
eukprot:COSAG06_NODE_13973_length_1201_cov_0.823956_2_plen_212_part_01